MQIHIFLNLNKTNNSFHGVEKTSIKKGQERCSINWHIRLTDKSIEKIYKIKKFKDFARNNEFKSN